MSRGGESGRASSPVSPGPAPAVSTASVQLSELTLKAIYTAILYHQLMGRGLGTTQRAILGELDKLPIESWPRGIPVVDLAEALGCSDSQVRTAVYAMQGRGLVTVVKEPRPGRQGQSLVVWKATTHTSWQNFINGAHNYAGADTERDRREDLARRGLL